MPRAHAVLQLAFALEVAAYVGVLIFSGSVEGGASALGGTTMPLILVPMIVSSSLMSGANERFARRLRTTWAGGIAAGLFMLMIVAVLGWGVFGGGYPWWVAVVAAVVALILLSIQPVRILARTLTASEPDAEGPRRLMSLPVRLTTVFLGVFFGLLCAVLFVPALGWVVTLLGLVIVLIGLAARGEPWSFLRTGYEWRLAQWVAFGVATAAMSLLAVLVLATDAITPGMAVGAGGIVAVCLAVSAFLPGRSRGTSPA